MASILHALPSSVTRSFEHARCCTTRLVSSAAVRMKYEDSLHLGFKNRENPEDNKHRVLTRRRLEGMHSASSESAATIKHFVKSAKFSEGWDVFASIPTPNAFECTAALNLCARASWFDRAVNLWEEMPTNFKDVVAYSAMIDVYVRCKRPDAAEKLFVEMESAEEVAPNLITYTSIINAFGVAQDPDKAMLYFQKIPSDLLTMAPLPARQRLYNVLMSAFARSGNYAKAREIFIEMSTNGVTPTISHFTTLLSSCARDANPELSQGVFDLISKYGLTPELETWTVFLSCNRYNLARCLDIMSQMRNAGISPSGLTYVELLTAHVIAKDWVGAKLLLDDCEKFQGWQQSTKFRRLKDDVLYATSE